MTFDLTQPAQWDALGAAWRVAHSNWLAALDLFSEREREAQAQSGGAPGDAPTREAMLDRLAQNEAIAARVGVPEADAAQAAASDLDEDLIQTALSAPAPTLAAFMLKCDMLAGADEWSAFDRETWPLFLADVRRFVFLQTVNQEDARQ